MKKFLLIFIFLSFVSQSVFAKKIDIPEVSNNKIWVYYSKQAKVNYIAFVGGGGMKGNPTKSGNPVAKFGKNFREAGSNYYIFPNPKKKKALNNRKTKDHIKRISILIDHIKRKNNLPIVLLGHSRGSISVTHAANEIGKEKIDGIVILASITDTNGSKKTPNTKTMRYMLKNPKVPVLVVHHEKDGCNVTRYSSAKSLAKKHNFKLVTITGGGTTGEVCGPFHYHGFENKMPEVIQAVHSWSSTLK